MKYQELYSEYNYLLHSKTEFQNTLAGLKDGYISTKTISRKNYSYLQHREGGKLLSVYIKEEQLPWVRDELDKRATIMEKIKEIDKRMDKIETAAGILDSGLRRGLITLRRCAAMEAMSLSERENALAFGKAMAALEGITASETTERNLSRWSNGDISFQDSFINTLQTYNLMEL